MRPVGLRHPQEPRVVWHPGVLVRRLFPPKHDPPPRAFDDDDLSGRDLVQDPEPLPSRLARRYPLHVYNVQLR